MKFKAYIKIIRTIFRNESSGLKALSQIINNANLLLQRKTGFSVPLSVGVPKDGLYYPEGIDRLKSIAKIYEEKTLNYSSDQSQKVNVFIPSISADLIFGGYISLYNFLGRLIDHGYDLRLIICEHVFVTDDELRKQFEGHKLLEKCLVSSEIGHWHEVENITFGRNDINIGYSWVTMNYASKVAQNTFRKPIFFIQEYESIFYPNDSFRALCDQTYGLPHKAIFNSEFLKRFFQKKNLSVFKHDSESKDYVCFEHTFADLPPPKVEVLAGRKKKKLLFYARPENHAARNLFELATFALIQAIQNGVFDDSWEFYGVGSLKPLPSIALANGHSLKMLPRVSFDEYKRMLSEFDVGLCPMYAPHPSVPPFEMASAGLISVTTTFENRSKEEVESISGNIIACTPTLDNLVQALKHASEECLNYDKRVRHSRFDWPRKWSESFDDQFMRDFKDLVSRE